MVLYFYLRYQRSSLLAVRMILFLKYYSKGVKWMFRYNFGSLAFGSFLLALVWFIIIVFEYLNKKLNGGG